MINVVIYCSITVAFVMPQFLPESKESGNTICARLKNPELYENNELNDNQTITMQIEGTRILYDNYKLLNNGYNHLLLESNFL